MKRIDICEFSDDVLELRKLHYEMKSKESLLKFYIENGVDDCESYIRLWESYIISFCKCQKFREDFCVNKILPKYGNINAVCREILFDEKVAVICD